MSKERTPEQVLDDLITKGLYEETNFDKDETNKILELTNKDYEYVKILRKDNNANWRIIFNIHYDVLRQLCACLMQSKKQKTSNHQGLFAFIIINFPELDFDWNFFELIRNMRNLNKYKGKDISKEDWKKIKLQMDLYISAAEKLIINIQK